MTRADEIASEQQYFDRALECREHARSAVTKAPEAGASAAAQRHLKLYSDDRLRSFRPPEEAVAFGRIDKDGEPFYLGYNVIWDGTDVLVVNWQLPEVAAFFEATFKDPMGLDLRRQFECDENTIVDFDDIVYRELTDEVERLEYQMPSDALLTDLDRSRTGEMHDIVRTIQAAQYELLRAPHDRLLIIQGGPGTGKTAVALHRVSWLLYNHREVLNPSNVLVVGPNTTFVRYIGRVLPSLGDQEIRQVAVNALAPQVRTGREETPEVARLKGEQRMMGLVERALADRARVPEDGVPVELGARRGVTLEPEFLEALIERAQGTRYNAGRAIVRQGVREEVQRRLGIGPNDLPPDARVIDAAVDRVWPQFTAPAFLQDLFGSEARILRAGGDEFSAREVRLLYRRAADRISEERWSAADLPLLDFADQCLNGPPDTAYEHIVVDEAQDLSPMQLLMLSSRSVAGHMTILGDIAQSTGPWARDDWAEVSEILLSGSRIQGQTDVDLEELEIGYRVPRQIFDFAAQLLPHAAPGIMAPRVVREGPAEPGLLLVEADDLGSVVADTAMGYSAKGYFVGVITPPELWDEVVAGLDEADVAWVDARRDGIGGTINLITPTEAKGLEFDAVVVVEPAAIARDPGRGDRLLYVALTRSTKYLSVVHSMSYSPLGLLGDPDDSRGTADVPIDPRPVTRSIDAERIALDQPGRAELPTATGRLVDVLARDLAGEIRAALNPTAWSHFLDRLREELSERPGEPEE
jgi:DNA helicase IV